MENPLIDLAGRTVAVGNGISTVLAIDTLLRLHADPRESELPITLYIGAGPNADRPLSAVEAIQLISVIGALRSPVFTFGIGVLHGLEPLLLASGERGRRHLLPHALVCIREPDLNDLKLANGAAGLNKSEPSLREQAKIILRAQIQEFSIQFGLAPEVWCLPRVLTARESIKMGFADCLVPTLIRSREHESSYSNR